MVESASSKRLYVFICTCICVVGIQCFQFVPTRVGNDYGILPTAETAGKKVCASIDIRNRISRFEYLRNCTVIEGSLQILLMHDQEGQDLKYEEYSFPELVEITEYLLLYRVYGLKSLKTLFPNLSVIRGKGLFYNYALVVYEMIDLEELGLASLTTIERGAVRLEKNPNLCYIDTVDWSSIARDVPLKEHFFKGNKYYRECINACPPSCNSTDIEGHYAKRCWSSNKCQKFLECGNRECRGVCDNGICCNQRCLGGCRGPTEKDCISCKKVTYFMGNESRCMDYCLEGTYKFENRWCLLENECLAVNKLEPNKKMLLIPKETTVEKLEYLCQSYCPVGYSLSETNNNCTKCINKCPKVCPSALINSLDQLQNLKECTRITGALEIKISAGHNIMEELEKYLGQIEEVDHYIWIHESSALISLHFFKSLRRINGKNMWDSRHSLLINNNINLQKLFREDVERSLEIANGSIYINFNRKLCYSKIMESMSRIKKMGNQSNDISDLHNGDLMPCNYTTLNLTIVQVTPKMAFLKWDYYKFQDSRNLLSYVIYYKEAPVQNVSIYDGRHACNEDVWMTKDVINKKGDVHIMEMLLSLNPWTQYAVFVQTHTTNLAKTGGISKIKYFKTAPAEPSPPQDLVIRNNKAGQLHLTWEKPMFENGNVTHYEVYWRKRSFDLDQYLSIDSCRYQSNPYSPFNQYEEKTSEEKKTNVTQDGNCCQCPKNAQELQKEENERMMQINFQDYLQSSVYIKKNSTRNSNKHKTKSVLRSNLTDLRQISRPFLKLTNASAKYTEGANVDNNADLETELLVDDPDEMNDTLHDDNSTSQENTEQPKKQAPIAAAYSKAIVVSRREFIIPNLGHFEDYNIEVIACLERDPREPPRNSKSSPEDRLCSSRALAIARTKMSATADNINSSSVSAMVLKNTTDQVFVTWKPPDHPNGLITSYDVEFQPKGANNFNPFSTCVSVKKYLMQKGVILKQLGPGNYSYRVRARSLAGNGTWTTEKFFFIAAKDEITSAQNTINIVIGVLIPVLVLIVVAVVVVWWVAKRKYPKNINVSANPDYMSDINGYTPDEWEVPRDKVKISDIKLGNGSFGIVYEGFASHLRYVTGEIKVAIKTVNASATYRDKMNFLHEASIMKAFKTYHVVQFLGVVSDGVDSGLTPLVIMELMKNGDLKHFLRRHRPDDEENNGLKPPTLKQIIQMAGEIADGMAYLADKKCVHRDLAARNCMVDVEGTVKIGDFGMTRDIYEADYYRKSGKGLLPVRWMAPESLKDGVFTSLSDVWSYGVVIWEMATLAAQPYQGLSNEEVLKYVISEKCMDKPEGCPDKLFDLMRRCWAYRPRDRPTFKEIIEMLVPDLDVSFKERSYFFTEPHLDYYEDGDEVIIQDESRLPFLKEGTSGSFSEAGAEGGSLSDIDDDRIDIDTNFVVSRFSRNPLDASEPCDCVTYRPHNQHTPSNSFVTSNHQQGTSSTLHSAIVPSSADDSKESSKSSSSSNYNPINGINVHQTLANGHVISLHPTTC